MKQALDNIFRQQQPISRYVEVEKKIGRNRYKTFDVYGRVFNATSELPWKPGDTVEIQLGRIIARSGKLGDIKEYEV